MNFTSILHEVYTRNVKFMWRQALHELYTNFTFGALHELYMNFTWTHITWTLHGLYMFESWAMNFTWSQHELLTWWSTGGRRSNECFHHCFKADDAVSVFVTEMPMSRITSSGNRVAYRRTVNVYHWGTLLGCWGPDATVGALADSLSSKSWVLPSCC